MDDYIITTPEKFADNLLLLGTFDAITISHTLEHCFDWQAVVTNVSECLVPGGKLFLSFPSSSSLNFPSRKGTLNFRDDPTHVDVIKLVDCEKTLKDCKLKITVKHQNYRPLFWWIYGAINEFKSKKQKRVLKGTWAYWGFETVMWAKK